MPFQLTSNEVKGPLRWWYTISAPPDVAQEAPLKDRERVRIGKLTSLALFIELIEIGIAGYSTTEDPNKTLPFVYLGIVATLLIALFLNHRGKIRIASILVLLMIEIGMALTILGLPHQELSSFNLPLFGLYIQPLLIAASLFPIWLIFPLAFYHIICICLALTFMAKTPELLQHLHLTPYTAYGIPITLQVLTTMISFIWISSAYEEMRRAETAEEVNRLTKQLADQVTTASGKQEELERNIEVLRTTLASISNGNYQQLVPLTQQDILWPLALSLNTLLNRTRSFREQGLRFTQLNTLLGDLSSDLHQHRTGRKNIQLAPSNTGTTFDLLVIELRAWLTNPNATQTTTNQQPAGKATPTNPNPEPEKGPESTPRNSRFQTF